MRAKKMKKNVNEKAFYVDSARSKTKDEANIFHVLTYKERERDIIYGRYRYRYIEKRELGIMKMA